MHFPGKKAPVLSGRELFLSDIPVGAALKTLSLYTDRKGLFK